MKSKLGELEIINDILRYQAGSALPGLWDRKAANKRC